MNSSQCTALCDVGARQTFLRQRDRQTRNCPLHWAKVTEEWHFERILLSVNSDISGNVLENSDISVDVLVNPDISVDVLVNSDISVDVPVNCDISEDIQPRVVGCSGKTLLAELTSGRAERF